jgi:hypothetical protein
MKLGHYRQTLLFISFLTLLLGNLAQSNDAVYNTSPASMDTANTIGNETFQDNTIGNSSEKTRLIFNEFEKEGENEWEENLTFISTSSAKKCTSLVHLSFKGHESTFQSKRAQYVSIPLYDLYCSRRYHLA